MEFPFKMNAIAAVSENGVIGDGPNIPWRIKEDFQHFKATTMGGHLIMGRKTFESIGKPLPGRVTIVVSSTLEPLVGENVLSVKSLEQLSKMPITGPVWVCGGATIYEQLLPHCNELILSRVHRHCYVDNPVLFPDSYYKDMERQGIIPASDDFTIEFWERTPIVKRLPSVETEKVQLEVGECSCGYHFGVDATYLDQVGDFEFHCPSCARRIKTVEVFPEDQQGGHL